MHVILALCFRVTERVHEIDIVGLLKGCASNSLMWVSDVQNHASLKPSIQWTCIMQWRLHSKRS